MLGFDEVQTPENQKLQKFLSEMASKQVSTFRQLGVKCGRLEDLIEALENSLAVFQEKQKVIAEELQSQKIRDLKDKQNAFLIHSLEDKVQRLSQSEELTHAELQQSKKKNLQLELELQDERSNNAELQQEVQERAKQVRELIRINSRLNNSQQQSAKQKKEPYAIIQQLPTFGNKTYSEKQQVLFTEENSKNLDHGLNNEEYYTLERKIKELEEEFNSEIQNQKMKNKRLEAKIKTLTIEAQQQNNAKLRAYELQLKLANATNQCQQLQASFSQMLKKNNQFEIASHKKALEFKETIQKYKKQIKKYKMEVDSLLRKFASDLLGEKQISTLFIGVGGGMAGRFQELKKHLQKLEKRNSKNIQMEKDLQILKLQQKIQSKDKAIKLLQAESEKKKHSKPQKSQKSDKELSSKNNSLNINKSHNKSDNCIKEKEKIKMEHMIEKLAEQQKIITDLRRNYDEKETELARKQLNLEAELTKKQLALKQLKAKLQKEQKLSSRLKGEYEVRTTQEESQFAQKLLHFEEQKTVFKQKIKATQLVLSEKTRLIQELTKKLKHQQQKVQKYLQKWKKKEQQTATVINLKQKSIAELIQKNKVANLEVKLLQQRVSILQINGGGNPKDLSEELIQLKQDLLKTKSKEKEASISVQNLQQSNQLLQEQIETLNKKLAARQEKDAQNEKLVSEMTLSNQQLALKMRVLQNEVEALKKSNEHYKTTLTSQRNTESFSKIKEQYQKKIKSVKIEYEHRVEEYKKIKKEYESKIIKLSGQLEKSRKELSEKREFDENAQKINELNVQLFREREEHRKSVQRLGQEIQSLKSKSVKNKQQNQICGVISNGGINSLRPSAVSNNKPRFKSTDSFQLVHTATMTENPERQEIAINTIDLFEAELRCRQEPEPLLIHNILDDDELAFGDDHPQDLPEILIQADEEIEEAEREKDVQQMRSSQLVKNLNPLQHKEELDEDVFQICDEEEEVQFVARSANLELKDIFSHIRREIQKLFNQEEISMSALKMLPVWLQDDFLELTSYVKQKIGEIRVQNEISFIMAEPGNAPESLEDSLQLPELVQRRGSEGNLRRVIEEKQALINSLMNERVSQENTINQLTMEKEEIEQQNENKFMNQCNIYKKEIKEHKKQIDLFQMNFMSLVNIVKNILEIYSDEEPQEDDYRDNMTMLAKIAKLGDKDRSRINFHIHQYLKMKDIQAS